MPVAAVLASSAGMIAAIVLSGLFKETAFVFLIGVAFFGGPFIWLTILATHVAFRKTMKTERREFASFAPKGYTSSLLGITGLLGVLLSTWWIPDFHVTLLAGPPWLVFLTLCYFIWRAYQNRKVGAGNANNE